jgi:hypothetical protein
MKLWIKCESNNHGLTELDYTFTYSSTHNITSNSRVGTYVYADPAHPHAVTRAGSGWSSIVVATPLARSRPQRRRQVDMTGDCPGERRGRGRQHAGAQ